MITRGSALINGQLRNVVDSGSDGANINGQVTRLTYGGLPTLPPQASVPSSNSQVAYQQSPATGGTGINVDNPVVWLVGSGVVGFLALRFILYK